MIKKELVLMKLEKFEAIRIYQSPSKSMAIAQYLHVRMRLKYGHFNVHGIGSNEIYTAKHLQAILDLLRELEQKTTFQLKDERKSLCRKEKTRNTKK